MLRVLRDLSSRASWSHLTTSPRATDPRVSTPSAWRRSRQARRTVAGTAAIRSLVSATSFTMSSRSSPATRTCCAVGIDVDPMIWPLVWPSWPRTLACWPPKPPPPPPPPGPPGPAPSRRRKSASLVLTSASAVLPAAGTLAAVFTSASAAVTCVPSVVTASAAALATACNSCRPSAVSCHVLRSASVIGMSLSPLTRTGLVATSLPSTTSVTRYSPGMHVGAVVAAATEAATTTAATRRRTRQPAAAAGAADPSRRG